ncbi:hypothetical protein OG453_21910 [Streptomyces sp. NBC_01381]|uniref:hypothetical protein n=1 Tax=Streptomyces sp. NBC_01381 TaxID=2903845 RepID=UPI00224FF016|nr:hypothetical protein [Streptomyces sp. NBC_01381]MCX4669297.1 hypothetical protein [Streptomyces sp. NBC_01381]
MALLNQGVRQGSPGRAGPDTAPAYLRMGAAVALYATAAAGFIGYEIDQGGADGTDFLKSLYDPRTPLTPWAQTPQDWALIATALVFGGIALARRRVARGALMLLAVILIGLSLRELVGLAVSEPYRQMMDSLGNGQLLVIFRVVGLFIGIAILAEMARAGRRSTPPYAAYGTNPAYGGYGPPPPFRPGPRLRPQITAAGVCVLLGGLVAGAWLVYRLTRPEVFVMGLPGRDAGVDGFFRAVVDASYGTSVPYSFHSVSYVVAPLLVGVLLLRDSPAARGTAIALSFISLYLDARGLYSYAVEGDIGQYFDSTLGTLALLSAVTTAVLALAAVALLLRVPEQD